jgi:hypothetical protein
VVAAPAGATIAITRARKTANGILFFLDIPVPLLLS